MGHPVRYAPETFLKCTPDSEALELLLDDLLVLQRLQDVQDDENQAARPCHSNDLELGYEDLQNYEILCKSPKGAIFAQVTVKPTSRSICLWT